jgi:hypothetical protein
VDHWEGDAYAIGVTRSVQPRRLVYISTFGNENGRYDFECEVPSGPAETDYDTTNRGQNVTYEELLLALEQHLDSGSLEREFSRHVSKARGSGVSSDPMTGAQHIPGQSPAFIERFTREVPGFADSAEYQQLDAEERQLPGFVFSALARFVQSAPDDALIAASTIIEDSVRTDDEELHNFVVTEMFEQWEDAQPKVRARLRGALGIHGRTLYDRWMNIIVPKA